MSGNRVERLESRVEELEASVSGLTDELMQTKSRLADLEDEVRQGLLRRLDGFRCLVGSRKRR